jgi:hypothetical protein
MRPDPIVEQIRKYREAKAAEYGYDPVVALKDFMRLHEELMTVRGIVPSVAALGKVRAKKVTPRRF